MPDFALRECAKWETVGMVAGASRGTQVYASATVNTKGAWTQLVAATTYPTSWVTVYLAQVTNGRILVDIGVGAATAEVVMIPNLHIDATATNIAQSVTLPLSIPAGSRISARTQASVASAQSQIVVQLGASSMANPEEFGVVTDYGTNTATSGVTALDPGNPVNSYSTWVQLVAATTYPISWLSVSVAHNGAVLTATTYWSVDIGIGAGGSEQLVIPSISVMGTGGNDGPVPSFIGYPCSIPDGTRIAARPRASITTATERLIQVAVYGVS